MRKYFKIFFRIFQSSVNCILPKITNGCPLCSQIALLPLKNQKCTLKKLRGKKSQSAEKNHRGAFGLPSMSLKKIRIYQFVGFKKITTIVCSFYESADYKRNAQIFASSKSYCMETRHCKFLIFSVNCFD